MDFFFIDTYIQKARKVFTDSRVRRNLNSLNTELQDVQRIMVQNIDDVLQRGTVLSGICFSIIKSSLSKIPFFTKKYPFQRLPFPINWKRLPIKGNLFVAFNW